MNLNCRDSWSYTEENNFVIVSTGLSNVTFPSEMLSVVKKLVEDNNHTLNNIKLENYLLKRKLERTTRGKK